MADSKLTALAALANVSSDDIIYVVNDPSGTPTSNKISVEDLFSLIPVDTLFKKTNDGFFGAIIENDSTGTNALSWQLLKNDVGTGGMVVYGSNYSAVTSRQNKLVFFSGSNLDGIAFDVDDASDSITFSIGGTEIASISATGTTGIVSKTSGTLTDGATVTVNGASKDQATFDWTANTASVSLVFSTGTAAQITSIFGKKTLAGDVTVTLDTTDYHFVDNDGADITSLTITNDSTTNKYFELSFLKSATFTESSKPVIKVLTSAI